MYPKLTIRHTKGLSDIILVLLLLLTLNKFNFAILVQSLEVLTIANLQDAASWIRTCAELEFKVC